MLCRADAEGIWAPRLDPELFGIVAEDEAGAVLREGGEHDGSATARECLHDIYTAASQVAEKSEEHLQITESEVRIWRLPLHAMPSAEG